MDLRRKLLWVDGLAAMVAGIAVLLLSGWLSKWYLLPERVLVFTGWVNLIYASYSLPLALRATRPRNRITFLVVANSVWVVVCLGLAFAFRDSASLLGMAHLVGEAFFVGSLARAEWRWRELLCTDADLAE